MKPASKLQSAPVVRLDVQTAPTAPIAPIAPVPPIALPSMSAAVAPADGAWSAELSASRLAIERQLVALQRLPLPAEELLPIRNALALGQQVLRSMAA